MVLLAHLFFQRASLRKTSTLWQGGDEYINNSSTFDIHNDVSDIDMATAQPSYNATTYDRAYK